jgi:hypothetical protein
MAASSGLRRIVVFKPRDEQTFKDAWLKRSIEPVRQAFELEIGESRVTIDPSSSPIPLFEFIESAEATGGLDQGVLQRRRKLHIWGYAVAMTFANQDEIERFQHDRAKEIGGVFSDPQIRSCGGYTCPGQVSVGTYQEVITKLNIRGSTGKGVWIAVVDSGINGVFLGPNRSPLQGSIDMAGSAKIPHCDPKYVPGSGEIHGSETAFDCLLGAPDAKFLDCKLWDETGAAPSTKTYLSNALAIFAHLTQQRDADPTPLVVNNGWDIALRDDSPVGSPDNYCANPNHPFFIATGTLVTAGADVLFAAGNCGADCAAPNCDAAETGPGKSISGANSHPSVMTVAAATVKGVRLGYSSQGPGVLAANKPDFAAYSHFKSINETHNGTSAAVAVAAGVVAALRQEMPGVSPAELKAKLQRCSGSTSSSFNYNEGFGIIYPARA